ncbi:hypothetical protein QR680_015562 [Steinernema hermaphroditum]|uniref:MADF domain-containing protein n=1 Tax=Steinernema hermaphroditum TaxID=289476 RepID=A0AA39HAE9_9BILA|nr:hypothetical protein QR680_015562 [Steinernema hermaphroditum]
MCSEGGCLYRIAEQRIAPIIAAVLTFIGYFYHFGVSIYGIFLERYGPGGNVIYTFILLTLLSFVGLIIHIAVFVAIAIGKKKFGALAIVIMYMTYIGLMAFIDFAVFIALLVMRADEIKYMVGLYVVPLVLIVIFDIIALVLFVPYAKVSQQYCLNSTMAGAKSEIKSNGFPYQAHPVQANYNNGMMPQTQPAPKAAHPMQANYNNGTMPQTQPNGAQVSQGVASAHPRSMAEYIAHLIELVEPHRCLYEKAHHLYYNVKYKEKIWKEIAGKWTVVAGKQMTVEDAKKKWASARDRYHRLKKAADLPSGSAADDGTAWEHMKPLQFLDSITEQRPTQSNFNESDSQNAEETAANASASFASSEHPEAQHKKRRKKVTTSERLCGLFTKVDGELREEREHERQERGPFFFWAMDIAKSLKALPRPTGLKLKMNISQMIFEAQLLEERENQFEHTAVEDFDGGGFEGRRFEEDHFNEDGFEENSI